MSSSEIRRLAAVMFTDIQGYTKLVQSDEPAALSMVDHHRQTLFGTTSKHQGKVIQFYGDGSLSIYESVIDALKCAIEIQRNFIAKNIPVRIGIHLGDIVFKEGTVFGDGVNIASRIESEAVAGSIFCSQKVQKEVYNHPEIELAYLGRFHLKNVADKIRLYAVVHPEIVVPKHGEIDRIRKKSAKLLWRIAPILVAIVAVIYYQTNWFQKGTIPDTANLQSSRIAVPTFENFTFNASLDNIGKMASHWITKGLIESGNAKVVSYESIRNESPVTLSNLSARKKLANNTGAAIYIEGNYGNVGVNQDSLVFSAIIKDLVSDEVLASIEEAVAPKQNPITAIQKIRNEILGFWTSRDENLLSIPDIKAYQLFIAALDNWDKDFNTAEAQLKEAIRIDSNFYDPYFYLLSIYDIFGRYPENAELIKILKKRELFLNPRQKNMLNYQEAILAGDNLNAYQYFYKEYLHNPKDLLWNGGMMVSALEDVNAFQKTIDIFNEIPLENQNLEECPYCLERISNAIVAYINLGEYKDAVKLIELLPFNLAPRNLYSRSIKVYARLGDTTQINNLIQLASKQNFTNEYRFLYYTAAREFYLIQNKNLCTLYATRCIEAFNYQPIRTVGRAYYLMDDLTQAYAIHSELIKQNPDNMRVLGQLGVMLARQGKSDQALDKIDQLGTKKSTYSYGLLPYLQARIYLHLGRKEDTYLKLGEAIKQGLKFQSPNFQYDPDLMPIHDEDRFQKLIHPLIQI